ncbi:ABC transporter substrate-binding protein [Caulobacter segnis]|uniref:ABC transporter substrate-binding protein n=1 Tax=Caulobacter segnis TaxID=88688 RepID=UPI00240F3F97|nr:ABC transporter substrate-binding protein [Caulobacter segnis]MDG2521844.1 ABC transporter substrate-binding protein [Caulobacter segnis]
MSDLTRRAAVAGLAAATASPALAAAAPRRVVSMNACLDTVLVRVADRNQIAALSHYARDPYGSTIVDIARTLPFTYETAEEVVSLKPDLVISSAHSSLATRNALNRLGVRQERFSVPDTLAESHQQVRDVALLVGHPERGEALIARINAAISAAAPRPGQPRLTAAIFEPNGFAAGKGTLVSEMMERCGFENVAARYGLNKWGNIRLEELIANPPQVLLAGETSPSSATWAERLVHHPALARIGGRMHRAVFPTRLLYCGGPVLIHTVAALSKAREDAFRKIA